MHYYLTTKKLTQNTPINAIWTETVCQIQVNFLKVGVYTKINNFSTYVV